MKKKRGRSEAKKIVRLPILSEDMGCTQLSYKGRERTNAAAWVVDKRKEGTDGG